MTTILHFILFFLLAPVFAIVAQTAGAVQDDFRVVDAGFRAESVVLGSLYGQTFNYDSSGALLQQRRSIDGKAADEDDRSGCCELGASWAAQPYFLFLAEFVAPKKAEAATEVSESAPNRTPRVLFGQPSVKSTFAHGPFKGKSINEVAQGLRNGTISPDQLPLDVLVRNGQTVTLNNRSLTALRRAGVEPTVINDRTGVQRFENLLDSHLGGTSPSDVIRVRGGPPGTSSVAP